MESIEAKDLRLADVVRCFEGEWSTGIVKKVNANTVELFRPYGTHADFSYTGGVPCYVGLEQYEIPRNSVLFQVYRRSNLK